MPGALVPAGSRSRRDVHFAPSGWTAPGFGAILPAMDGEDSTTLTPTREEEDDEGLGARFYLKLAGGLVIIGIVLLVVLRILSHAFYAWGFFGGFLALAAILLLAGWIYDRRHARA